MSYAPTRHGNPCIHCGDVAAKCRTHKTREMHLCTFLAGSKKGEKSQGYVVIGDTKDGRWSRLLPDNSSKYSYQRIEELHRERQNQKEEEKRQRLAKEMPAVERDKYYREILAQLGLNPEDKEDLVRRGFTEEQIIKSGFKSVERWQKFNKTYPANLPGISATGDGLITHTPGYACPIKNADGLIVGLQVRKRVLLNGDNQRYYFLSTNSSIRLNDEIPLAVFIPNKYQTNRIAFVEGVGSKPFLTSERLGLPVIGAAGGNWASSPSHLKASLDKLEVKPGNEVTLFADSGSVKNKSVVRQYTRVANLIQSWGYVVTFAWWGQADKSLLDIDELQPEEYSRIRYLPFAEFKALCIKWGGLSEKQTPDTTPLDYLERVAQVQKKLHTLSYPIDLVCDPSQKYLPNLVGRIPTKGIVALKSPKGSGKSHQIKLIKEHCCGYWSENIITPILPELPPEQLELLGTKTKTKEVEAIPEPRIEKIRHKGLGMSFLSINARIALGREQAIRWEFTWIEDADLESKTEFEGTKLSTVSIIENINEIGLCWDSLGKIFGRDWSNTLIVIDETELGLNHVATSSTCRDRRSFILHTLEHKLKECLDNDGLVILADADLTNTSLDYLTTIAPGHPPFIVGHDFKGDPWDVDFYTGKRDAVLSVIEEWVAEKDCRPIAVALDNQKEAESLSKVLTKKYPWLAQEVGGLIRIDSKVTQTDFGKDFVKRPNQSIEKYKPKILIYTPSLGVGCSIDIAYFAHVFGLFFGNLEPSQARQMLARVRQSVPRTVWGVDRASSGENEPTSYLPAEIKRRMFNYNDGQMTLLQVALTKANEMAQNAGIVNPEDCDILPLLIETLKEMMGPEGSWNNPHINLYCCQVARRNFALSQFAIQLRQELLEEGHSITDQTGEEKTQAGEAVKEGKKEIQRRDATLTANAKDITFEEAQEIKRKPVRTDEEEHSTAKAFLKHDLPGVELTPEFVLKAKYEDNGRWLAQAKLFWHIYNLDALKDKDEREWRYKLNQFSKGVAFLPDVKTDTPKIEAIIKSGILDWVKPDDPTTEYSNESPEGKAFIKRCHSHRRLIKTALNITIRQDSEPIKIANRILDRIGLRLGYTRKEKSSGNVLRYYKLKEELAIDCDRQAVWEALNQRWQERKSKIAENQAQHDVDRGQIKNNFLCKNNPSVPENKPEESPQNYVVEDTTDEWLTPENLASIAEDLEFCEDAETLEQLRGCYPAYALKAASNLLKPQKRKQIRLWVIVGAGLSQIDALVAELENCLSNECLESIRAKYPADLVDKAVNNLSLRSWKRICNLMGVSSDINYHNVA